MYRCLLRSLPVLMLLTVLSLVPALSGDACREMGSLVGPTCALADEAPQKNDEKADAKKDDKAQEKKSASSAPAEADAAPTVDPLENIWDDQKDMLDDINSSTRGLVRDINKQAETMSKQARPILEEARRLLLLINTFKNWPNPLEALDRRISFTVQQMQQVIDPVLLARNSVNSLLERVNHLAESLPETKDLPSNAEIRDYSRQVTKAQKSLTDVIKRYDSVLSPTQDMMADLKKAQKDIATMLPQLWRDYYLQGPVPYLSLETWETVPKRLQYVWQGIQLRLPVEIPVSADDWHTAGLRFALCLLLVLFTGMVLYRRWRHSGTHGEVGRHMFRVSLPWIGLGLSLLASSLSAHGDVFRCFLALGNLSIIIGEVFLAWDLRRLQHPDKAAVNNPLWQLIPLTLFSYILIYLPLPPVVTLIAWVVLMLLHRLWRARSHTLEAGTQLESTILSGSAFIFWVTLVLAVMGLHIFSMGLYLFYVSCSLALQISVASMSAINRYNDQLPDEGGSAAVSSLMLALAAPVILLLVIGGMSLWVCTLPGGLSLLQDFVLQGVNVGETRFNMVQVLLIISVFFLTRTAVRMGTLFLSRMPSRGLRIDPTLIQPLQTAFTYALWAFFGLFTLRSLGMELSNLAMVAGGLSVGIGFGMQTIINNFLSGLILIFSRTMQVGDVVEVGTTTGRVRKISVRATIVETYDNAVIYVPNSEFVSTRLINWTRNSRTVRRDVVVGVAYGSDTTMVMKLLARTAVRMGTLFLSRMPSRGLRIDPTLIQPLQTAFTYALWAFFGLFTLRSLGMELSNLAMVAGGLSVGIGFGMQTIINNFLSGLILIFSRTMQVGDVVEVGTTTGRVRKISVRATIVETYDNAVIYVPNSEFVSTRLINWTRNSRTVRRDVVVGVAYGSDTTLVMKLLASVANGHSDILKYPAPVVLFSNFGASTLDFTLRFWVRDYDVSVKTASELLFEIDQLFRKNNIEIAFPQMDVHIKDMPPRARSPRDMATRPTAALPDSPADRRAPHGSARPQRPLRNRKPRPGGKLASRPRPAVDDDTPTDEDRQLTA